MLLVVSQFIELFLLQDLKLEHSPDDQSKAEEDEAREKEDPDFEPIDRFSFHRMMITCSGFGFDIPSSSVAIF